MGKSMPLNSFLGVRKVGFYHSSYFLEEVILPPKRAVGLVLLWLWKGVNFLPFGGIKLLRKVIPSFSILFLFGL